MRRTAVIVICVAGLGLMSGGVAAQQFAYPAKGQSPERQAKDESECSTWATQQSGFNPAAPPPPEAKAAGATGSGSRVKGAAAGAAIGAVSGGDVGEAAVAGAVAGGVSRRMRNRQNARAVNEANAQASQAGMAAYTSARGACLSGRGYTVK